MLAERLNAAAQLIDVHERSVGVGEQDEQSVDALFPKGLVVFAAVDGSGRQAAEVVIAAHGGLRGSRRAAGLDPADPSAPRSFYAAQCLRRTSMVMRPIKPVTRPIPPDRARRERRCERWCGERIRSADSSPDSPGGGLEAANASVSALSSRPTGAVTTPGVVPPASVGRPGPPAAYGLPTGPATANEASAAA